MGVGGNVPRERRTYVASAMLAVSWMGAGEELGKLMQEMDDTKQEDTSLRGWEQELGWVAECSILSRKKGGVGVIGKEEGVVQSGTLDGRSDVLATGVQSIELTGPCLVLNKTSTETEAEQRTEFNGCGIRVSTQVALAPARSHQSPTAHPRGDYVTFPRSYLSPTPFPSLL